MNKKIIAIAIGACVSLWSCGGQNVENEIIGDWHQDMILPEQHVSGEDCLTFNSDRSFNIANHLCYVDSNQYFYVKIPFTVTINGAWRYNASTDELSLDFDMNTFDIAYQPATIRMTGDGDHEKFEQIKDAFEDDVKGYIDNQYRTNYRARSARPLVFTDVKVSSEMFEAQSDGFQIKYVRKK